MASSHWCVWNFQVDYYWFCVFPWGSDGPTDEESACADWRQHSSLLRPPDQTRAEVRNIYIYTCVLAYNTYTCTLFVHQPINRSMTWPSFVCSTTVRREKCYRVLWSGWAWVRTRSSSWRTQLEKEFKFSQIPILHSACTLGLSIHW